MNLVRAHAGVKLREARPDGTYAEKEEYQPSDREIKQLSYEKSRANPDSHTGLLRAYVLLGDKLFEWVESTAFQSFIMFITMVACTLTGIETYDTLDADTLEYLRFVEVGILAVFAAEVVLKVVGETTRPWLWICKPGWRWNAFDLLVVVICLPVFGADGAGVGWAGTGAYPGGTNPKFAALRLFRLARVAKAVKGVSSLRILFSGLVAGLTQV
jgi:hypothetical protein